MKVGVTGHQGIAPETMQLVEQQLTNFLLTLEQELIGVTSLAEGADQMFADAVLRLHGHLEVVVPSEHYGTAFHDPGALARFDALVQLADKTIVLEFKRPSEAAFMEAGREIVRRSDILVAIWDGEPSRGHGGTADVVRFAREHGVPVKVIWPDGVRRAPAPA